MKRIWAWVRKTYDWRDVRDFIIMPTVLAVLGAFCNYFMGVDQGTVIAGIMAFAIPVIFIHEWKDYDKHFPKDKK